MEENLENNLTALLDLQRVDLRLRELESTRGDLPQIVNSSRREIDRLEQILDSKNKELKEIEIEKSKVVMDRNELKAKLDQYQEQLYAVTSNREYDAITSEIETAREKIDEFEIQEIEFDDKIEVLQNDISEHQERYTTLQTDLGTYENDLQKKLSLTNQEEDHLKHERTSIVSNIERNLYNNYERVRKAKQGVAVVSVQRQACGGCFNSIPPQRVLELRQRRKFITCEHCGRILIWQASQAVG